MRSTERNDSRDGVIRRAAGIFAAFDAADPWLSLAELARRTGLPKPTAHRLIASLCEERLLERDPRTGSYALGLRLFELGELVPRHRSLSAAALPVMEDLREATRQRIHLAVLDGIDVVYVEILGVSGVQVASRTGGRLPAHATGVGKVLLAYAPAEVVNARLQAGLPRLTPRTITTPGALTRELRQIRENGTGYDREESQVGISCVAAPVFADGQIRAGLSVTGSTTAINPQQLGIAVRTAAFTLSRTLRENGL